MSHNYKFALIPFLLSSSFVVAVAQDPATSSIPDPQTVNQRARPSADENFDLNIDQRRIVRENFSASTAVGIEPDNQRLDLQIGVALTAAHIDVLLLNVRGRVRFRGRLDRILDVLKTRPAVTPPD